MWWWRCRWSVATTTTVFVLGIATVYSQLEISDLDKPSESYTLYLLFILAMLERAITGNGGIEGGRVVVARHYCFLFRIFFLPS